MKQATGSSSVASTSKGTPSYSKVGLKRGPWTPEEDELLSNYIKKEGEGQWRMLPKRAGLLRCGKSSRLRWMNYLRPSVKRGQISPDEEDLILRLHRLLGNRWALIAGRIPGRTDNEIKNYWNTHLSKKLISQGIDPKTHKPLNPNPNSSTSAIQPPAPKLFSKCINPNTSVVDKGSEYLEENTNLDQDHNWLNSSGMMMNLQSNGERDDIGLCNDEFSSFLNSLINDDTLVNQNQNQLKQTNISPSLENVASSSKSTFGYGGVWDGELSSSNSAYDNEGDHRRRFVDEANTKL